MYIPKSKQKVNPPITGGILVDTKTGNPYHGSYVMDHLGNYYKGLEITGDSEILKFSPIEPNEGISSIYHHYIKPSSIDYERGFIVRYFIKNNVTGLIKEVLERDFMREQNLDKTYLQFHKITWYLSTKNLGKNKQTIEDSEKTMKNIQSQILKSPSQFVV